MSLMADYDKAYKVVMSCKTRQHVEVAFKYIDAFYRKHEDNEMNSFPYELKVNLRNKLTSCEKAIIMKE